MKLSKTERDLIILLLKAERSTTRFLTGFGKPTKRELTKENFLDKLINKLYA